ncbi:hypothetical protein VTH8203_01515 [Vibrio thalassae]|uniref:HTH cro/C1-type domain-containing protein n=1 Tax=Vibrio thalassae TaxID=1243014 RepID=A0A240EIZ1_9VIBR|nr:helix-turn-helix domain-containing protein [Vibrio thalassae]SNX47900.1 hypothetical protein VTH8203_01515 [Vibrio thalassae]
MNQCPTCGGKKESVVFVNTGLDSSGHYTEIQKCGRCLGAGYVSQEIIDDIERGKQLRADRVAKGLTLREAAKSEGVTVATISQRENGNFKK